MRSETILNTVSDYFSIPISVFTNKCNRDEVVSVRYIAIYYHRIMTGISSSDITLIFNYKDHGSITYAFGQVINRMGREYNYKYDVDQIGNILKKWNQRLRVDDVFQENDFYTTEEMQRNICI